MARVSDSARRRASGEHGWRERGREAARQRGSEAGRQRGNGAAARPAGLRPLCPGAPTPGCGSTPGSLTLALGWWQGSSGACAGSTTSRWPSRCSARRTRSRSTSTTWSVHQCPPVPTHPGGALADGRPLALPRAPSCTRSAASVVARSLARSRPGWLAASLARTRARGADRRDVTFCRICCRSRQQDPPGTSAPPRVGVPEGARRRGDRIGTNQARRGSGGVKGTEGGREGGRDVCLAGWKGTGWSGRRQPALAQEASRLLRMCSPPVSACAVRTGCAPLRHAAPRHPGHPEHPCGVTRTATPACRPCSLAWPLPAWWACCVCRRTAS